MLFTSHRSVLTDSKAPRLDAEKARSNQTQTAPIGIDIGTSSIICGTYLDGEKVVRQEANAFFSIPGTKRITGILLENRIKHFQKDGTVHILGSSAEQAAQVFNKNTQRPMKHGLLNPREPDAIDAIVAILEGLMPADHPNGANICYSIPADPVGREGAVIYHASMLEMRLKALDFKPTSVNEGLAVIVAETGTSEATALGISVGGGMCNVCLAYLGIPVIAYSLPMAGDYIDEQVAHAVDETATHIKLTKERSLDLSTAPQTRIETALHIYYEALFKALAQSLQEVLGSSQRSCRLPNELPLFISGGVMLPAGSLEKFKTSLAGVSLPIKFSDIVLPADPAEATMRGAMRMAME
jgi:actin-like ATPase involved in cell morphogenesis